MKRLLYAGEKRGLGFIQSFYTENDFANVYFDKCIITSEKIYDITKFENEYYFTRLRK